LTKLGVPSFPLHERSDDLNLISDSLVVIAWNTNKLVERTKSVGLKINQDKTKVMKLLSNGEKNVVINDHMSLMNLKSSST